LGDGPYGVPLEAPCDFFEAVLGIVTGCGDLLGQC